MPRRSVKRLHQASERLLDDDVISLGEEDPVDLDNIHAEMDSSSQSRKRTGFEALSRHKEQVAYVEKLIEEIEGKARTWVDNIMDASEDHIKTQLRARNRVKDKIVKKYRHMRLADLCHMSGNDLNAALLLAVPPDERAAFLAKANDGAEAEDGEDKENDEDMPTTIKGRNPPRMVPATPKGGGRPAVVGCVTRSAMKDTRAPSSRKPLAAIPVAQTPTAAGGGSRVMRSARRMGGAPHGGGGGDGRDSSPLDTCTEGASKLSESAIAELQKREREVEKERAVQRGVNPDCTVWECLDIIFQPKIEAFTRHAEAVCAELRQNIADRSAQLRAKIAHPATATADDDDGKKKVPKKLKKQGNAKRAKPNAKRVGAAKKGASDAPAVKVEGTEEEEAEGKEAPAAAAVNAEETEEEAEDNRVGAGVEPPSVSEDEKEAQEELGQAGEEEEEEQEEEEEVGRTAKIKLSIDGGPYDGHVFEISVGEDDEARLVGRSTGKKFKNHGISLRRDSEVSITHGMFMSSGGVVTYMDNGSTNGTELNGKWVKPKKAYDISAGSKLLIGQSFCTVSISWER